MKVKRNDHAKMLLFMQRDNQMPEQLGTISLIDALKLTNKQLRKFFNDKPSVNEAEFRIMTPQAGASPRIITTLSAWRSGRKVNVFYS